jgi:hypothetical protein
MVHFALLELVELEDGSNYTADNSNETTLQCLKSKAEEIMRAWEF